MKKCSVCKELKELENFSIKSQDKRHSHCKQCQRHKSKMHYTKNKSYYVAKAKEGQNKRNEWLKQLKATLACSNCGETHPAVLDFHHTDSSLKEISIAHAIKYSKKRVLEEAAKCVVLCFNCHRIHHYNERNQLLD